MDKPRTTEEILCKVDQAYVNDPRSLFEWNDVTEAMELYADQFRPQWIPVSILPDELGKHYIGLQMNGACIDVDLYETIVDKELIKTFASHITHYIYKPELPKQ